MRPKHSRGRRRASLFRDACHVGLIAYRRRLETTRKAPCDVRLSRTDRSGGHHGAKENKCSKNKITFNVE